MKDIQELNKDFDKTDSQRDEIEGDVGEIQEDVEEIQEDLEEIQKEVVDTGEDVDEIKEDIEEIKEDLDVISKEITKKGFFSKVASVLPTKFSFQDIAQQIVGAMILSAPFSVTEEVWSLANALSWANVLALIFVTLTFDFLLFYYTKFQQLRDEDKKVWFVPVRVLSLLIVTYTTSFIVLSMFGVIGGQITDTLWAVKLVIMVGLFANIGAGTADLIR